MCFICSSGRSRNRVAMIMRSADPVAPSRGYFDLGRVDGSVLPDRKQDRALKSMVFGEDSAQLRQGLFRSILLVTTDQHDLLSDARAILALVDRPLVILS